MATTHLHPVEKASQLDSKLRYFFQNPKKIISKYIKPGMTILDIGCGTGYFTTEIAKLLNNSGKIVAVDVQQGMLEIIEKKIENCDYGNRIELLLSSKHSLQLTEKFDFILAFYSFFPRN